MLIDTNKYEIDANCRVFINGEKSDMSVRDVADKMLIQQLYKKQEEEDEELVRIGEWLEKRRKEYGW